MKKTVKARKKPPTLIGSVAAPEVLVDSIDRKTAFAIPEIHWVNLIRSLDTLAGSETALRSDLVKELLPYLTYYFTLWLEIRGIMVQDDKLEDLMAHFLGYVYVKPHPRKLSLATLSEKALIGYLPLSFPIAGAGRHSLVGVHDTLVLLFRFLSDVGYRIDSGGLAKKIRVVERRSRDLHRIVVNQANDGKPFLH